MTRHLLNPRLQLAAACAFAAAFAAALWWCFQNYPRGTHPPLGLSVAGKMHPLFVHLPIGFVLAAAALDLTGGKSRRHSPALHLMLWLTVLTAAPAVLAGYFLGVSGDFNQNTLNLHLWSGISVPTFGFLALAGKLIHDLKPHMAIGIYRIPLLGTATAVFVAGHFGGTLTHGDVMLDVKKLLEAPAPISSVVTPGSPSPSVYDAVIAPLLAEKCESCHGTEKSKGDLQLHSLEAMVKAGESGKPGIKAGSSAESESIVRMLLATDADEHMPPSNKAQPTAEETEILRWWIDAGARGDLKMDDASIPAATAEKLRAMAAARTAAAGARGDLGPQGGQGEPGAPAAAPAAPAPAPEPAPAAAPAQAPAAEAPPAPAAPAAPAAPDNAPVAALEKELSVSILPLAQNDPALSFNCVNVADKFGDAELAKFAPIAARMSEMNLARSKVTDAGLAAIAAMPQLKKLHLQNTVVTDAGIDHLTGLAQLEYLNLFNTKVTDAALAKLEKLPALKHLYVWETGVTKPAAEALHAKLPNIVINLGWDQEVKTAMAPVVAAAPTPSPEAAAPAVMDPEKPVYEGLIQPIFLTKCAGCHGEEKQKGKLAMHTFEALMKNGDSGEPSVVAGKSADSLIVKRVALPDSEDEHMPPSNKPQLTEKEFAVIKWWIDGGAKTDVKIKDAALPDNLK